MAVVDAISTLACELPDSAVLPVPVSVVRYLTSDIEPQEPAVGLTVPDLAKLYGRSPNTVRGWIAQGYFEGAYKLGREWRVPRAALDSLREHARNGNPNMPRGMRASVVGTIEAVTEDAA